MTVVGCVGVSVSEDCLNRGLLDCIVVEGVICEVSMLERFSVMACWEG